MSNTGIKDPTAKTSTKILKSLFSRTSFGVCGAVVGLKILPRVTATLNSYVRINIPYEEYRGIYKSVGAIVVGIGVGLSLRQLVAWLRLMVIKGLLSYHGWLFRPTATSTKIWGLILKLMVGPGPHGTFEFEKVMPKLPIPPVEDTCERYLTMLKPLLSEDEHKHTESLVNQFLNGDAHKLQQYLKDRDKKMASWLSDWWLSKAYLARRDPLAINVNFFMSSMLLPEVSKNPVARAAICLYNAMRYQEMVQTQTLPPDLVMNTIPVCMDGARFLFSSCRIPGEKIDRLEMFPNSTHSIVLCKGIYYRLEMYEPDSSGKIIPLTKLELKRQLECIIKDTEDTDVATEKDKNAVAVLTAQDRTTWAKNRERLMRNPVNASILRDIESAIFFQIMGNPAPQNFSELAKLALAGDGTNRWFDKSNTLEVYNDSTMGGANMEHSGPDATHFNILWEHCLQMEEYGPDGDLVVQKGEVPRNLKPPKRLVWQLDDMQEVIYKALNDYRALVDKLDCIAMHTKFGKSDLKKRKVSPDGFLQMAVQLAYWRMQGKVTKTYEPASTRLFAFGRTDNVNPVSEHSVKWVKMMDSEHVSRDQALATMRQAIRYQTKARLEATAGYGCERHLLGLSMAASEIGLQQPAIFKDKAFHIPMYLSTSQVPTQIGHLGLPLVPESILGGFGPGEEDGYGVLYCSIGDDMFNFVITSWHTCAETDSQKLADEITAAMNDMRDLMDGKGRFEVS